MSRTILVVLNNVTLAAVTIVNALSGSGTISGKDVGEVSQMYDNLFTPAGYAFSIWGIIYLSMIGFVGFLWTALLKKTNIDIIDKTGVFFIISNLANITWLFLWLNQYIGLSVLAMVILLLSLIALVLRLRLEMWDAPVRILLFVWWPIAIYLGWIIVATVANVAAFLISLGYDGSPLSPQAWTILMILVATGIYLFLTLKRNLRESAMVGIWALVAIAVRQGGNNLGITITAYIATMVLLVAILYHGYKNRSTSPFNKFKRGEF